MPRNRTDGAFIVIRADGSVATRMGISEAVPLPDDTEPQQSVKNFLEDIALELFGFKGSPDQPRDDHGRWAAESDDRFTSGKWQPEHAHLVQPGVAAGGRYIPSEYGAAHSTDTETKLVIAAKNDPMLLTDHVVRAAQLLGPHDLVVSMPSSSADRLAALRGAVAGALGLPDAGPVIARTGSLEGYRTVPLADRSALVRSAGFEVTGDVAGHSILLIDDTWASGAQTTVAREALLHAGATQVEIAVGVEAYPPSDPHQFRGTTARGT